MSAALSASSAGGRSMPHRVWLGSIADADLCNGPHPRLLTAYRVFVSRSFTVRPPSFTLLFLSREVRCCEGCVTVASCAQYQSIEYLRTTHLPHEECQILLSITASAIAVAQLGCAVAKDLYQIADDIGMAGLKVRLHAQYVGGFSRLLVRIQHTIDCLDLKTRRREAAELRSHIGRLLSTFRKILQPIKDEIECSRQPLLVRFHDSPTKLVKLLPEYAGASSAEERSYSGVDFFKPTR